jgi:hypothetical protein
MRPTDFGALIPIEPEPAESVQNWGEGRFDVPLLIGIVDPQQELPAVLAGEKPIEQRRPHAADVKIAGGAGSESRADSHDGCGKSKRARPESAPLPK